MGRNSRDNITCMITYFVDGSDWTAMESLDEDVKKQYLNFLKACKFPQEPCVCSLCGKWTASMNQCPCMQVYYCSRRCQKAEWKTHKTVCPEAKKVAASMAS